MAEKFEALQLLKKDGISKACRQLGLSSTTLYNWQRSFEQNGERGLNAKPDQGKDPEFEKLKRENHDRTVDAAENAGGSGLHWGGYCQESGSAFVSEQPKLVQTGPRQAGRVCSTAIKRTGGYEPNTQMVEDIKALLAQEFPGFRCGGI